MNYRRPRRLAAGLVTLIGFGALVALVAQGGGEVARAQYGGGTPVNVSSFGCIFPLGGHRTVPAGSTIVIRQGFVTNQSPGEMKGFLASGQTTIVSASDAPMIDASDEWGEPVRSGSGSIAFLSHDTGVTLHNPGDSMRFTFALIFNRPFTDVSDYDGDGVPDPMPGTAGLAFGGTCTVTAA